MGTVFFTSKMEGTSRVSGKRIKCMVSVNFTTKTAQ